MDLTEKAKNTKAELSAQRRERTKIYSHKEIIDDGIPFDFPIYALQRGEAGILFGQGAVGKGFFLKNFFTDPTNILFEKPISILYISLEDGYKTISKKYSKLDICHNNVDFAFDLNDTECWAAYDCVIIDTWSRYNAGRWDENSNKEMSKAYENIISEAKKADCCVLVVAHINKSSIQGDMDITSLRGASTLADNSRLGLSLRKRINDLGEMTVRATIEKVNNKPYAKQDFSIDQTNGNLTPIVDNTEGF